MPSMRRVWLPAMLVLVPILAISVARAEESEKKDTPPKDETCGDALAAYSR